MTISRSDLRRFVPAALAIVLAVVPLSNAWPAERPTYRDDPEIAACIRRSAGGRSWLEKTLWGLRDQEGGWAGAQVPNRDGSHDLGPLQVNSWWAERIARVSGRSVLSVRYWLANDVCFNVDAARWIFLSGLAVTGDYWKAIGVYHSPTGFRQRWYAASVAAHLRRRFGRRVFDTPTPRRP